MMNYLKEITMNGERKMNKVEETYEEVWVNPHTGQDYDEIGKEGGPHIPVLRRVEREEIKEKSLEEKLTDVDAEEAKLDKTSNWMEWQAVAEKRRILGLRQEARYFTESTRMLIRKDNFLDAAESLKKLKNIYQKECNENPNYYPRDFKEKLKTIEPIIAALDNYLVEERVCERTIQNLNREKRELSEAELGYGLESAHLRSPLGIQLESVESIKKLDDAKEKYLPIIKYFLELEL